MYREWNPIKSLSNSVYDLKAGCTDSKGFYNELGEFTTGVFSRGEEELSDITTDYVNYAEESMSREDALLDMLIFGVLLNEYFGKKISYLKLKSHILKGLFKLRRFSKIKQRVDAMRGKLSEKWLVNDKPDKPSFTGFQTIRKVLHFLDASCEFQEETIRMRKFKSYLKSMETDCALEYIQRLSKFAAWFKSASAARLGRYTGNHPEFMKTHHRKYKGREDYFFCGRSRVEYHLNMVGAEMMNRVLRQEFEAAAEKVLLLPTCMVSGKACKAKSNGYGLTCKHCTKSCHVSETVKKMAEKGVKTIMIRHSSSFSKILEQWAGQKKTALIGTACVLNLLKGGFEMKRLGIPSQCIFLDFPGCRKHWLSSTPTCLSLKKLKQVCEN